MKIAWGDWESEQVLFSLNGAKVLGMHGKVHGFGIDGPWALLQGVPCVDQDGDLTTCTSRVTWDVVYKGSAEVFMRTQLESLVFAGDVARRVLGKG